MPRQWERIARDSRLALQPRSVAKAEVEPTIPSATAVNSSDLDSYRAVQANGPVGNEASVPTGVSNRTLAAEVPVPAATPITAEITAASGERSEKVEVADARATTVGDTGRSVATAPNVAPKPVEEEPQDKNDVRILPEVNESAVSGPVVAVDSVAPDGATPERAAKPNEEARTQQIAQRSEAPGVGQRTVSVPAIPEPAASVADAPGSGNPLRADAASEWPENRVSEPSSPAGRRHTSVESGTMPVRPFVPEPRPVAVQAAPQPAGEPTTSHSQVAPAGESAKIDVQSNPVDQAPPAKSVATVDVETWPIKAIGHAWEEPSYLLAQLEQLQNRAGAQAWAKEVTREIGKLGPAIAVGAPQTASILRHLDGLANSAPALAGRMDDQATVQQLCRTAGVLQRHVAVWRQIGQMGGMVAADAPVPAVDARSLNKALADMEKITSDSSEGHAWRKYLLVDSLREWAARRRNGNERVPPELAQQVRARLNHLSMTSQQRMFLTTGPAAELDREMLRHTAEAVESNRLLQHLENYERSGLPSDARLLARDCQFLSVNSGVAQRDLGDCFEKHYRNANLRLAVSAELLNRMMPKREPEYAPVEDTIQGATVRGQSVTANEVSVRMIPDPNRVLMELDVNGEVAAVTRSTSGPATFYTDSESSYSARKPLVVDLRGIRMWPTEVSVDNNSKVRGVRTDFDRVPLFDRIARNVAISQYDEHRPAADAEVRGKIAAKAKERVDHEATEQVTAAAKRLHDELLGPMDSLLLDPTMISAETTEKRFSMRIRLAGPDQLGGHTPRPQAPSDSLASVQIHESLLNNMLQRLELDGQTFDLAGLNRRLSERLQRFQPRAVEPDQEDVKITFAASDAVHVRCNDGHLEVTLAIACLSKGTRRFKDFQVRATYKPTVEGRAIELTRDGIVKLIGPRMNAFAQVPLRSVFLKIFSDQQPIRMTPESFVKNAKLDGVAVTQFVIDDGWIGAALGPQRSTATKAADVRAR
jgi:hypothetical protein